MSNYYQYQDVKVMIAHRLMKMPGWEVYGYHADQSDAMTDYFDPAYWNGIAQKNGYILCVDVSWAEEPTEVRVYDDADTRPSDVAAKIRKLEQMTVERGASEQEEASAKASIERLLEKNQVSGKYHVTGMIPGHLANPPRSNWHIEKDGVIVAKGTGILKFAAVNSYYLYPQYQEDLEEFKSMGEDEYRTKMASEYFNKYGGTMEATLKQADYHIKTLKEDMELINGFETFIRKLDATCGGMIGEGEVVTYETVTVTKYRTIYVPKETTDGAVREGQLFILNQNFNYGCNRWYIYRIHERKTESGSQYYAYRLNGKHTKECTGSANPANYWGVFGEKFHSWIKSGAISWCVLESVKEPYQKEKTVQRKSKPTVSDDKKPSDQEPGVKYLIEESEHTKTHEPIWLVKIADKVSREEFIKIREHIQSLNGYYSRFTHSFVFGYDPTSELTGES